MPSLYLKEAIMGKPVIQLILTEPRRIKNEIRDPRFVMLEAETPENVTVKDINLAIQLGVARAVEIKQTEKKPEAKKQKKSKYKGLPKQDPDPDEDNGK